MTHSTPPDSGSTAAHSAGTTATATNGILPSQELEALARSGSEIRASRPILPDQIQPASLDLRLGAVAYRVRASFLPGRGATVAERLRTRIENRVIGADANPYVALAATLACGYLGMVKQIEPSPECRGDAYLGDYGLPRSLGEALALLRDEADLAEVLGHEFVTVYTEIKEVEYAEFMKVISPWEREHLLLHV